MREAELKHARVAMMAFVGIAVTESGFVFPGLPTGGNQVNVLWTLVRSNPAPLVSSIIFIGMVELFSGILKGTNILYTIHNVDLNVHALIINSL